MCDRPEGRTWAWLVPVVRFPVTRIVLAFAALALASYLWLMLQLWVVGMVLQVLGLAPWELITLPVALHLAYVGYVRLVERRSPSEFARAGAVRELARGILVGAALPAAVVGLVARARGLPSRGAESVDLTRTTLRGRRLERIHVGVPLSRHPPPHNRGVSGDVAGPPDLLAARRGPPSVQPQCNRRQHGGHPDGQPAARRRLPPHPTAVDGDRHPLRVDLHAGRHLRSGRVGERSRRTDRVAAQRPRPDLRRQLRRGGFPSSRSSSGSRSAPSFWSWHTGAATS